MMLLLLCVAFVDYPREITKKQDVVGIFGCFFWFIIGMIILILNW